MGDDTRGRICVEERDGLAVVVKRVDGAAAVEVLRIEADRLAQIRHPGVVEFVDFRVDGATAELATAYAGSQTLADYSPADAAAAARLMAALATVVGDLHVAGMTHGALAGDHVVFGSARHPVLCGFGCAGPADDRSTSRDLHALGEMFDALLAGCPESTGRAHRRRDRAVRRVLTAWRAEPSSAAELARLLAGVLPPAESPGPTESVHVLDEPGRALPFAVAAGEGLEVPDHRETEVGETRTWRARVLPSVPHTSEPGGGRRTALTAAVVIALALGWWSVDQADQSTPTVTKPVVSAAVDALPPPQAPQGQPSPEAPLVETVRAPPPAPEDDAAPEGAVLGNMVWFEGDWFEAGDAGDTVVVGDWDCDGMATPAVFRPGSGEVFVFATWPGLGAPIEVAVALLVPDAGGLVAAALDGCDALYPVDHAGRRGPQPLELG